MSDSKKNIPSADFCFASSVAGFALKLAESKYIGDYNYKDIQKRLVEQCGVTDEQFERFEFLNLVKKMTP